MAAYRADDGAPQPAASRGNVFTLSILQGESGNPTATFTGNLKPTRILLGSAQNAQWRIRGPRIEGLHAELAWDGNTLWIRDAGSFGGTYLGVERIEGWRQVHDGIEILLGQVLLAVRAVGPDAHPASLVPGVVDDDDDQTDVHTEDTRPQPAVLPRVRGATAPPSPAFLDEEKTVLITSEGSGRALGAAPLTRSGPVSEQTVITQSPYAPPPDLTQPRPAAGARISSPPPDHEVGASTIISSGPMGVPATSVRPPTVAGVMPVGMPVPVPMMTAPAVPAPPPPMLPPTLGMAALPVVGPGTVPPPGMPTVSTTGPGAGIDYGGGFGTPVTQPGMPSDDPFGPIAMPPPPGSTRKLPAAGGKTTLPPRTLIMALATGLVGLMVVFMGPAPARPQGQGATAAQQVVVTVPAQPPATNNILQLPIGEPGLLERLMPAPIPTQDAHGRPVPPPPPNLQDPIRLAAEAAAGHRYEDAARLYEQLAAQHPEAPIFQHFALILRTRMSQPCPPGSPGCSHVPPGLPGPASPLPAGPR